MLFKLLYSEPFEQLEVAMCRAQAAARLMGTLLLLSLRSKFLHANHCTMAMWPVIAAAANSSQPIGTPWSCAARTISKLPEAIASCIYHNRPRRANATIFQRPS